LNPPMNPSRERLTRWAMRGALSFAAFAAIVGTIFNVVIALALREVGPHTSLAVWFWFILRSALLWGGGAMFFGALLGICAAMIWRDGSA
jgi:hypothetical protein